MVVLVDVVVDMVVGVVGEVVVSTVGPSCTVFFYLKPQCTGSRTVRLFRGAELKIGPCVWSQGRHVRQGVSLKITVFFLVFSCQAFHLPEFAVFLS